MSLKELIDARDVEGVRRYMAEHNLVLEGSRIVPRDAATKAQLLARSDFWNQRQQAR